MTTRIVEMGYSKGRLSVIISREYEQFATCQKVGLVATKDGITIRPGGSSASISANMASRYPSWRFVFTRCQFRPKVEFAQVPVHVEELPNGWLLAKWPEADMIKPPRRAGGKRREKLDFETARGLLLDLCGGDESRFEALVCMADDFIHCLELVRGEED